VATINFAANCQGLNKADRFTSSLAASWHHFHERPYGTASVFQDIRYPISVSLIYSLAASIFAWCYKFFYGIKASDGSYGIQGFKSSRNPAMVK